MVHSNNGGKEEIVRHASRISGSQATPGEYMEPDTEIIKKENIKQELDTVVEMSDVQTTSGEYIETDTENVKTENVKQELPPDVEVDFVQTTGGDYIEPDTENVKKEIHMYIY